MTAPPLARARAPWYCRVNRSMDVLARRILLNLVPLGLILVMAYATVFGSNGLMARHRMLRAASA